jgi:DNA gyrase/topoisomerase IV subunit A
MLVQLVQSKKSQGERRTFIHEEMEKRYLAYALSTIVSRALPDGRDGLKPVHRRILYAMHAMGLSAAAKMRKSAAVVGEVIGKFHPHGDQAAYEALVRMAQDFSLRYPLVHGSGNFGSLDGDSPAAMRYTETRLSAFAANLLSEIDRGTTDFRPTYDGIGQEPDVLPAMVPNLLLNGSSGIAVGMSCSFPPHNLREVLAACRAAVREPDLGTRGLLKYVKGPDFPTGGEIVEQREHLAEIYARGHGLVPVRGTFEVENRARGLPNLVITSIPYSVNKSRLIERIAQLVKDRRLKHVRDVRDESTEEVRIVLELKGATVSPESVMAFLCKHTDLQINFPVNLIAITPQGVPERLSLDRIIRYFLEFRYEKTVLRLEHRLTILQKRIHLLEGFDMLFQDLDAALRIIRSARSRQEAEDGLRAHFDLDKPQVDAILEMRLYKLVGLEMGKLLDELAAKKREAHTISRDLASPDRLWKIVDQDLAEVSKKFGDSRRTRLVGESEAEALTFDPDEFVEHEDVTVILSEQGWIRRMKMEVEDASSLKFREGDSLLGWVRVNTARTVALFSNFGKIYISRVLDIPATAGFGEPVGSLVNTADGEFIVALIAPDPASEPHLEAESEKMEDVEAINPTDDELDSQGQLFRELGEQPTSGETDTGSRLERGILITRSGKGFRFHYEILREPTKRTGRKLVNLRSGDEVVTVVPETSELVAIAASSGHILVFPTEQIPVMSGPAQGVRMIRLTAESSVLSLVAVGSEDSLRIQPRRGEEKILTINEIPAANRGSRGKGFRWGITQMRLAIPHNGDAR